MVRLLLTVVSLALLAAAGASAQSRIPFNAHPVWLSGSNVAWVNFSQDLGPDPADLPAFREIFDSVHACGGNCMRLWLHTNGAASPEFNGRGEVVSPGVNATANLKAILDLAWQDRIGLILTLWSFDMLRTSFGPEITDRAKWLLTDTARTGAYIRNALVPMVSSVAGHPAIVAWEVFNEAEGMTDEFGWDFTEHVPMASVQRFVNIVAGAIHRTDPAAKVTTGAWCFLVQSDVNVLARPGGAAPAASLSAEDQTRIEAAFAEHYGAKASAREILSHFNITAANYYRDDRLVAAGGDPAGTLDFYTVHYYDWGGVPLSPFHHPYVFWKLDKPLVVAEFYANDTYGVPYASLYRNLLAAGYAGAMTWKWHENPLQQLRTKELLRDLSALHPDDPDFVLLPLPYHFLLEQNYPNPFNASTIIRYDLPFPSRITLTVFNLLGQEVARLVEGDMEAGAHQASFSAANLASGCYFYRLSALPLAGAGTLPSASMLVAGSSGPFVQVRKLTVLR
ncbi:MAG TPA: T9SS type A sorting domain-containing protein [Bacteroidota bacterium]